MKPYERHQEILNLLRERNELKVTELAEIFQVSEGTIRNDLDYLDERDQITRVRGGAAYSNTPQIGHPAFAARAKIQASNKLRIARWAADMVKDGDAIFLDASTTAFYMCSFLRNHRNLTVLTCGIETALALAANPTCTVILMGGIVHADSVSVTGSISERALEGLHIRMAFVSCAGFSVKVGLTETDMEMAHLKRQVVLRSEQVVALIESSKFDKAHVSPFAAVNEVSHILTDNNLNPAYVNELQYTNTVLTVCGENTTRAYTPHDEQADHFKIGFANLSEDRPYAVTVRRSLEEAAQQNGHVDLILGNNQYSNEAAFEVADRLIAEGVDLAIEYHFDVEIAALLLDKLKEADIPVIAVDTPVVGATYFGVDNYRAGWDGGMALGNWIQRHWQGRVDNVIILEHTAGGPLSATRVTGQMEGLCAVIGEQDADKIIRIDDVGAAEIIEAHITEVLQSLPKVRRIAVISLSDSTAESIIRAARALGREEHLICVAQGAGTRFIRDELARPNSRIAAATLFRPEEYGKGLIALAERILHGEQVPPAEYIRHVIVDRKTLGDYYS
ncbi:MAG: substrate-binding domain-containing protein [Caldilineaceae bacterium]|nr:substrate-binding domain-containing protein [Caldilineaceae bacterium]